MKSDIAASEGWQHRVQNDGQMSRGENMLAIVYTNYSSDTTFCSLLSITFSLWCPGFGNTWTGEHLGGALRGSVPVLLDGTDVGCTVYGFAKDLGGYPTYHKYFLVIFSRTKELTHEISSLSLRILKQSQFKSLWMGTPAGREADFTKQLILKW